MGALLKKAGQGEYPPLPTEGEKWQKAWVPRQKPPFRAGPTPAIQSYSPTQPSGVRSPALLGPLAGEGSWVVTFTIFLSGKGRVEG